MLAELDGYSIDGCYNYHDKRLKLGLFIRNETGDLAASHTNVDVQTLMQLCIYIYCRVLYKTFEHRHLHGCQICTTSTQSN